MLTIANQFAKFKDNQTNKTLIKRWDFESLERERKREEGGWDLGRKGAVGGELVADEIAGGDVRDAEEVAEAAGIGAFSDARATQEHPLDIPLLLARRRVRWEPTRHGREGGGALYESGYGRHRERHSKVRVEVVMWYYYNALCALYFSCEKQIPLFIFFGYPKKMSFWGSFF